MSETIKLRQLDPADRPLLEEICFQLTGSRPDSEARLESCFVNILRRMQVLGISDLRAYLGLARDSQQEFAELVSALTIHTTSWFRESPHFDKLIELAQKHIQIHSALPAPPVFRVLSAACSSGEEAYTIALVLERLRQGQPSFDYLIEGWDIDLLSVEKARRAIYECGALSQIPSPYQSYLRIGQDRATGFFTLQKSMRQRTQFLKRALEVRAPDQDRGFHIIFCRNVLIYFKAEQIEKILPNLIQLLAPQGTLFLGHSEGIEAAKYGLKSLGHAAYQVESADDVWRGRPSRKPQLILVGASTGGTEALLRLLRDMPKPCPPIVIVQHIATSFARSFAERLSQLAGLSLGQPLDGSELRPNHLYMAWDDYHIGLKLRGEALHLEVSNAPPLHSVRPAVDHLFQSATRLKSLPSTIAILMTGMGKDGARGLLQLKNAGAMTLTQDEASSVVYGMPGEAVSLGASHFSASPEILRQHIIKAITQVSPPLLKAI